MHQTDGVAVLKGIAAGIIGGLVGTWAMNEFGAMWSREADGREPQSAAGRHDAREWQERNEGRNANELAAQVIADHSVNRPLTRDELAVAAPTVHFAFGASVSALYGGLAELSPRVTTGRGLAFGTAVWAVADEVVVPWVGLARRRQHYPLEAHLQALASHFVFGLTTEAVRRGVRAALR